MKQGVPPICNNFQSLSELDASTMKALHVAQLRQNRTRNNISVYC